MKWVESFVGIGCQERQRGIFESQESNEYNIGQSQPEAKLDSVEDHKLFDTHHPKRLAIPIRDDQSTLVTVKTIFMARYAKTSTACPMDVKPGTRCVSTHLSIPMKSVSPLFLFYGVSTYRATDTCAVMSLEFRTPLGVYRLYRKWLQWKIVNKMMTPVIAAA